MIEAKHLLFKVLVVWVKDFVEIELGGILLGLLYPLSTKIFLRCDFVNLNEFVFGLGKLIAISLLKAPNFFKDSITFPPIIFCFILKGFPIPIKPLKLILYLFPHVPHLLFQIIDIIFPFYMFVRR